MRLASHRQSGHQYANGIRKKAPHKVRSIIFDKYHPSSLIMNWFIIREMGCEEDKRIMIYEEFHLEWTTLLRYMPCQMSLVNCLSLLGVEIMFPLMPLNGQ